MPTLSPDNPHHALLSQRLPSDAQHFTSDHWSALRTSLHPAQGLPGSEADWFANAAPYLREALLDSQAQLRRSQMALARSLKGLQSIAGFAEPLLRARLLADHGLSASLPGSELIRVYQTYHWTGARYLNSHDRQSLLEAALHNFGDDVSFSADSALALSADIEVEPIMVSSFVTISPDLPAHELHLPSERYRIKRLPLSPADFAQSCRQLDLGRQYQDHLQALYEAPANRTQVREQGAAVYRDQLRVALALAHLHHHLDRPAIRAVQALLDGKARRCWVLGLLGATLHDALAIDADDAGVLLYLPGDTESLQQYADFASLGQALQTRLLAPGFRRLLIGRVPLEQRASVLDKLRQRLDASDTGNAEAHWQPRADAKLQIARGTLVEPLFGYLQDRHLERLKAEARLLAVPTADADVQASDARKQRLESFGLNVLNLASFFIPGLGEIMLAVTAWQLLNECIDGVEDWYLGDRDTALQHAASVGINLSLIAGLAVAGKVATRLFNSPLMERLDPVTLADGSDRLWQPDLAPYRSDVELPEGLEANQRGQYLLAGKHYIRIEGQLYEQRLDADGEQWRIVHPQRPEAWQPPLLHNDEGAWRAAHEQPLDWTYPTLVRRLNEAYQGYSDAQLQTARLISGIDRAQLRQVHLRGEPCPPLLADSLQRLTPAIEPSPHESSASLQLRADYPHLNRPLAARLLRHLQPGEISAWQAGEPLPAWFSLLARQVNNEVPLSRALEGLFVPGLASSDSEHLLLACLQRLPGWSPALRLELRGASPEGPLLASIGDASARQRCMVLKSALGYEAWRFDRPAPGTVHADLYAALLEALPATQRQALGLMAGSAEPLRLAIQAKATASREQAARWLWGHARPAPARARLLGGTPSGENNPYSGHRLPTAYLTRRMHRLYPSFAERDIAHTLQQWRAEGINVIREVRAHEQALRQLRQDLQTWAGQTPRRQRAIEPLVEAWRHNSARLLGSGEQLQSLSLANLELENHDLQTLVLPDRFFHIRDLDLGGNRQLSQLPAGLLARFPDLERVYLDGCRFDQLPNLVRPARLEALDMGNNRLTWDGRAQSTLHSFTHLRLLELSNNPLLQAPDLRGLPALRVINLTHCSLTELPTGLASLDHPVSLDLGDNQFTQLPEPLQIPEPVARVMCLESNWLSPRVLEQIETYYLEHGVDLLVAEGDYEELLSGITPEQRQLWNRLPLAYRRALRVLTLGDAFARDPQQAQQRLWQRIERMDQDPAFLAQALGRPAGELLELPLPGGGEPPRS
ncbi:leucine-rich repeat domain-containing protein [Pseudomonas tructae]|uniref:Leucine-rich repeat domain-containing protein n=1 Tax=Pseudomonas tructae TaxID=2518644 RepID=A0A411MJH1_9PSED|nr:leucine-rich repeat domain-containing protein [Pseudomonas tructae]QBF26939.1 leucine-rich repeat domain-containing protein [Pseudomonas tructae]